MSTLPPTDRMYRALVERDTAFAGVFVVGIRSTGIFCRVGCTARRPRPENCEYFPSPKEALLAGYRACKRCRPLDGGRTRPAVVERLIELVERDPSRRVDTERLLQLRIDPSTARRQFLRHCGMTFHAYQRSRRLGLALQDVREHRSIPRAMDVAGYGSFSGFGKAFSGIFGKPPSRAGEVRTLLADWIPTPMGPMVAVADDRGLHLLEFHDRRALERELAWLRRRHRAVIVPGTNAILRQIRGELDRYFEGSLRRFRTPLALEGSEFQRAVWGKLLKIPAGETMSYAAMAKAIGRPSAVRAVGRANGDNRLAIVVPCHRVIRSDGELCGYGGGLWRKKRLLEIEADVIAS